jgi:hypothetical protein
MDEADPYGTARARERRVMEALARVVVSGFVPAGSTSVDELRQLGYAAQLARGSVADPDGHLAGFVKFCRQAVAAAPAPEMPPARDGVQHAWGAPFHVDARKLRAELPLHISRIRQAA